jgi:1-phosphofructokinase
MLDAPPDVCVFAPSFFLTVSIEKPAAGEADDELHFHPGGQGFWIARMLTRLGVRPVLIAPVGGEPGEVLRSLTRTWAVPLEAVPVAASSPAYVHDRRSGTRDQLAQSRLPKLDRHELDDLYGNVIAAATSARLCVVTGLFPGDSTPLDFYRRLGADLESIGVLTVGDLHGEELSAFLEKGMLHTLKVSDDDLVADGLLPAEATLDERTRALRSLLDRGIERVVVSAARGPTMLGTRRTTWRATAPVLETVDSSGSGDSMTAGLVYGALHDLDAERTIRMACAAGAANAIRRGLGNADGELVRTLAERVTVEERTAEAHEEQS